MSTANIKHFPSFGYLEVNYTRNDLIPLINEVEQIKKHPENYTVLNASMSKETNCEYELQSSKPFLKELLLPNVLNYIHYYELFKHYTVLKNDKNLDLLTAWVNIQRKNEYNPVHAHIGLISFVIWLEVPYEIEQEIAENKGRFCGSTTAGSFTFQYINALGKISPYTITIDKNMLYKCIIFPASMSHQVHPFFSSNGERVSVSGNFVYDV